MGKRQVGELEASELVSTFILSEIVSLPVSEPDTPLLFAIIPVLLIVCLEIIITYSKNKVNLLKNLFEGKPSIIIYKGELDQGELEKMRISIQELLSELRLQGIMDISQVEYAILEEKGKLSTFLKSEYQPLTPSDAKIKSDAGGMAHSLIIDGKYSEDSMSKLKLSREAVKKICRKHNCQPDEVFLLTIDDQKKTNLILKDKNKK
jgi:uncharacterized membrane protein YcaP (DUF421 family)